MHRFFLAVKGISVLPTVFFVEMATWKIVTLIVRAVLVVAELGREKRDSHCERWLKAAMEKVIVQICRGRVEQILNFVDSRETLRMRLAAGATAEELYVGFDSVIARWFKEKQLHNVSRNLDPVHSDLPAEGKLSAARSTRNPGFNAGGRRQRTGKPMPGERDVGFQPVLSPCLCVLLCHH